MNADERCFYARAVGSPRTPATVNQARSIYRNLYAQRQDVDLCPLLRQLQRAPSQISGFLDDARRCAAAGYDLPDKACDENAFTAYSATQNGAPVYTGEPSARALLSFFEARGYSIQDF
jgi:hypothetical protein